MQIEFLFPPKPRLPGADRREERASSPFPLVLVRHPRARKYILRVGADGVARVTIPRGGSAEEARRFAGRHFDWIERQRRQCRGVADRPSGWVAGSWILFRGESVQLTVDRLNGSTLARFGDQAVPIDEPGDLRPALERHLWRLAKAELPLRVAALAAENELVVRLVTVRNQRSRWGSCSRRGTISLNWRLIQSPDFVRDYIILHELMHLREMSHSRRFWQAVAAVCPDYRAAERWLKQHRDLPS